MSPLTKIREYVDPNYNPPALPHITSERSRALAFELFNARYRQKLPTMLTMNYKPSDETRFDRRLIDRWHEVGFCRQVENTAPSRRRMEH